MMVSGAFEIGLRWSSGVPLFDRDRLLSLLHFAASSEGRRGEIGVWLCTDEEIADLHLRFMGIEGPTDVISFPGDSEYPGDIAVSFETASEQALEAGHAVAREIAYLTLHGLLHLFGYDDLTTSERSMMLARQDTLLAEFEEATSSDWD